MIISELQYQHQEKPCFKPLSFDLQPGCGFILRGDNGSGKTTVLQVLAGLRQSYEGSINNRPDFLFIGHKNALSPRLNGWEMLDHYTMLATQSDRHGAEELVAKFNLNDVMTKPLHQLSAGQQRKVSLLRLKLLPRTLWLLDEPYSNLDLSAHKILTRLITEHLATGGMAIVSAHQQLELNIDTLRLHAVSSVC